MADSQIQQASEVSGVHHSNGNTPLRKMVLSHAGDWVPLQAYPKASRGLHVNSGQGKDVERLPHRKKRFTFLCICQALL